MRIIYVKNVSGTSQTWIKEFTDNEEYQLQTTAEREMYAGCDPLLTAIGSGDALIGNGDIYFGTINEQLDWLMNEAIASESAMFDGIVLSQNANNFYPCPDVIMTESEAGEFDHNRIDSDGNLMSRSAVLTDEGSFRNDFSGSSLSFAPTGTATFINGSYIVEGSGTDFMADGVNADGYIKLSSHADSVYAKVYSVISATRVILAEPYQGANGSGTASVSSFKPTAGTGASIAVASSEIVLATGTTNGSEVRIERLIDYGPMRALSRLKISQRIANQSITYGYADSADPDLHAQCAHFQFDGTTATQAKCRTRSSADSTDLEETTITLPNALTTASYIDYWIDVQLDQVAFYVNGVQVAIHKRHLPGPYTALTLFLGNENTGTAASSTNITCDYISTVNINQVEVQNTFTASPVYQIVQEDVHYLTGKITATTTGADQIICSYTVPANKTLFLVGYSVSTSNIGGTVKVGKNTITTPPASPGVLDDNIFRMFKTADWGVSSTSRECENFGANPIRIGFAGDVVKIAVTPKGSTSSDWYATLDFVLR